MRCRAWRIRSSMGWTTLARSPLLWIGPSWAGSMVRMWLMRPSFWEMNISTSLLAASLSGRREPTSRRCPMLASFEPPSQELKDADVHVCFVRLGDLRTATNATDRSGPESWIVAVKYQIADAGIPVGAKLCGRFLRSDVVPLTSPQSLG